jgi:hypothetical protein
MRLGIASGPLLLLMWQIAPIQTGRDSTGKVRMSFGYGGGRFEHRTYACDGGLTSVTPVPYRTGGAQLEFWEGRRFRFSGFGGHLSSNHPDLRGAFGGVLAAYEGGTVGVGGGAAALPLDGGIVAPSFYLRVGALDRLHVQTDLAYPEPAFGTTGILRAGLGFNQGRLRGLSGFGGVSVGLDADGKEGGGAFGQLWVPVHRQLDLSIQAAARSSAQHPDWGLSIGMRYNLGR